MKKLRTFILCGLLVGATAAMPIAFSGCQTPKQTLAYNTIYTIQKSTMAAYDNYLSQVIAGNAPTNGLPEVSDAFNKFQLSSQLAMSVVEWNTNAPATAQLESLSTDLLALIFKFTNK